MKQSRSTASHKLSSTTVTAAISNKLNVNNHPSQKDQTEMEKLEVAPQETMMNLIGGFWIARALYLAALHRILFKSILVIGEP